VILKASQRGGAKQLGQYLLRAENEQVEVHEVRGFVSSDLKGAMKEADAIAKGTRCVQHLFSASLNPPGSEAVSVEAFKNAADHVEEKMGLSGQPRIIVFHENGGRRHAHVVWSRIDADTMTARPMSHFKMKLRAVSKALYLEHGWQMPRGLMDSKERDPRNFDLAEWQQAKRMARDPKQLASAIQECWAVSNSKAAFAKALEERGLYLAKGDRRGHVAVTYEGEVLSIARMTGIRTKDVVAKLGKPDESRSVEDARAHITGVIAPRLKELIAIADQARSKEMAPIDARRIAMKEQHANERQRLDDGQKARANAEARSRAARLRHGVMGLWDRMTGQHGKVVRQNEAEAFASFERDRDQRQALVADQLAERRSLQREILSVRQRHTSRVTELHRDLARQLPEQDRSPETLRDRFTDSARSSRSDRSPARGSGQGRGEDRRNPRGPELGR